MEIDDIYKKVIESARDIKYIREDIVDLKRELKEETAGIQKEMKEETKSCHKRISQIKDVQNLNVGKLSVILITIGAVILGGVQLLIWVLGKIIK